MYIEFSLPRLLEARQHGYLIKCLLTELQIWSERNDILYRDKYHKWTVRVTFDDPKNYSFFALTWTPALCHNDEIDSWLTNYRFIEPMNVL